MLGNEYDSFFQANILVVCIMVYGFNSLPTFEAAFYQDGKKAVAIFIHKVQHLESKTLLDINVCEWVILLSPFLFLENNLEPSQPIRLAV